MYFYDIEEIKNRIKEKNIPIQEMAKDTGITRMTLFNIIKGVTDFDKMTLGTYKKIVNYLWK